jgi:hypothetical protein
MFPYQMRAAEQTQVLRDRGPRNRERFRDLASRLATPPKQVEHRTARGVGESLKRGF